MTSEASRTLPVVRLDPALADRIRAGAVTAHPVDVVRSSESLDAEMSRLALAMCERHVGRKPSEIPGLQPARDLYRSFGVDPTKTRPSSEALLRRVLKGLELPRISNAVDLSNLLAVRYLLPIGLYDARKISGPPLLREGVKDESYEGIRKAEVNVAGRPVIADDSGAFGNPTSDSLRTSVDGTTRAMILVIFAPASFPSSGLDMNLADAEDTVRRFVADAATVESYRIEP